MANISRDERIKRENPTLTAYQLLEKGISQEFYNKLVADNYQPEGAEKIKPEITQPVKQPERIQPEVTRAKPKTTNAARIVRGTSDMAYLKNKKTGKMTRMTRASAILAARLDKGNYEVL